MKYLLVILLLVAGHAFAKDQVPADTVWAMKDVQVKPGFPGGMKDFYTYVGRNYKYPKKAREENIQGKIEVEFIIEKDGSLSNFKVTRHLGYGTGEEAVRMLKASPKWTPGLQDGQPVRVRHNMPITLNLGVSSPAMPGSSLRKNNTTWY